MLRPDVSVLPESIMSATRNEPLGATIVTITVRAGLALVRPPCEELLLPILSYQEPTFRQNCAGNLQHVSMTVSVCAREGDALLIPAGCVERVSQFLTTREFEVQIEDSRGLAAYPYEIDQRYLRDAESWAPGLADAIGQNFEGLIEVVGSRRSCVLGCMCQLFHSARIFVACKSVEAAQSIAADLGHYLGGEVEAVRGWNWSSPCRVVCGTFGSLDRSDPADWPILIFADAFEGVQKTNIQARAEYLHRRVYAFVDPRRQRSPRHDLLFETLAGPVIYRDPQCRRPPAARLLAAFATHASPGNPRMENARDQMNALWNDTNRNQAVADCARILSASRHAQLGGFGLLFDDDDCLECLGPRPGVIIIVASVSHGELLHRLLPDWHFFHSRPDQDTSASTNVRLAWGIPPNSIVTVAAVNKNQCLGGRIIIWASGGKIPYIPTCLARSPLTYLLIDFWDDGNQPLAASTQQRLSAYRSIGCRLLNTNLEHRERALARTIESDRPARRRNTSRRRRRSHRPSV